MQHLPLSAGQHTLVDDADYEPLLRWNWLYLPNHRGGYAIRHLRVNGRRIIIYLHRLLLAARPFEVVDHVNGCGLDNRRHNLRCASPSQNGANRPAPARAIPYRGVYQDKRYSCYFAQIKIERVNIRLGTFPTMEAAARAYDRAAGAAFGVFARLNFPGECEQVEQLALPLLDESDAEPWSEDFEFPDPPKLSMDSYEFLHLRRWAH